MPFVRKKRGQVLLVHNRRGEDGRVEQLVLHAFSSPADLVFVERDDAWQRWTEETAWRHADVDWSWDAIRARLREEREAWEKAPQGASERRRVRVGRLAAELAEALRPLTLAKRSDAALVEAHRTEFIALETEIARLLGRTKKREETEMRATEASAQKADEVFDEGMEHWWMGDRSLASRYFRKTLKLDPMHADAHNHLGIAALDRRRFKEAEVHFTNAIQGGERGIEREGRKVLWGNIDNRPYLRGLGNLAILRRRQKRYEDALEIHERLLKLNPDDNQGVRFLVPEELHRLGRLDEAIRAYRRAPEFPESRYGLALVLHAKGQAKDAGIALLSGFAGNCYVPPLLLGEPWQRRDVWHATNLAEPEWAEDYLRETGDLWRSVPDSLQFLRFWWQAPPVRSWLEKLDALEKELTDEKEIEKRRAIIARKDALMGTDKLAALADRMLALS
jgi:tetratricopeptide (TPR) repeat protein